MNRLFAMSLSLILLASQSLPADANGHGNGGNGQSAPAPAQQRVPIQQTPRQTLETAPRQQPQQQSFQRPQNTPHAAPSSGHAPVQSNTDFQAHPSAPQPIFRTQLNVAPTYRTAPAFRSSQPTSWSARFAQNRPDTNGGGGPNLAWNARSQQSGTFHAGISNTGDGSRNDGGRYIAWRQRFRHGSDDGYWHQNSRGGGNWNNHTTNNFYNSGNGRSGGNLTVPILAVAAAITLDAFHSRRSSCSCDSGPSTTIINNGPVPAPEPTAYAYHSNPDYSAHDVAPTQPDAQVAQVAGAASDDTHAPYLADSDLPAYDDGPAVVHDGDAPADEYFGSTHMSILGIRNSITDTNQRAVGAGEETGHNLLHMLLFTEQAFHDWQRKYPHDRWIIANGYELVDDFAKLDADTPNENPHVAAIHGIDLGNWLDATYPGNEYASR